jgi:hypothetical protein
MVITSEMVDEWAAEYKYHDDRCGISGMFTLLTHIEVHSNCDAESEEVWNRACKGHKMVKEWLEWANGTPM